MAGRFRYASVCRVVRGRLSGQRTQAGHHRARKPHSGVAGLSAMSETVSRCRSPSAKRPGHRRGYPAFELAPSGLFPRILYGCFLRQTANSAGGSSPASGCLRRCTNCRRSRKRGPAPRPGLLPASRGNSRSWSCLPICRRHGS